MTALETVYAVHNFEAENDDELTFQIGEPVIVIQKDDGFNDGWWKGKNMRGEVGIFPMNYITFQPYQQQQQQLVMLPTPSTSDTSKKSSTQYLSHIDTAVPEEHHLKETTSPSTRSSYSFTCPISSNTSPTTSNNSNSSHSNTVLRRLVISSLFLPSLRSISPEEWDVDQVEVWLNSMNFGSIAANFKSQEITGDILLELNMEALKELAVPTFGKRFKIHTALNALREECGYQVIAIPSHNRMSIASSTYSEEKFHHQRHESPTSPNSSRYSNPIYHRQTSSYHSNLMIEKQQSRKSHQSSKKQCDKESVKSPKSETSAVLPTSDYDIMETSIKNYEKDQNPSNQENKDDMTIQQVQKRHTVLPMAQKSSMDIYASRSIDENGKVTPDMEGWLHKQGCKYKKWNKRWFVLKGPNLFYFKSPKDVRMKGIINLRGYRIIPDESIQPGKYCFKAQHEEERTFYFYTDVDTSMRAWTFSLMKATISRDFNAPVLSSSMIPTVSLDVARRMRPRPPSVLLYRKENNNKISDGGLSPRYGDTPESANPLSSTETTAIKDDEQLTNQDSGFDSDPQGSNVAYDKEEEEEEDPTNQDEDDETEPFEEDEGNFEQEDDDEELEHLQDNVSVESFSSWTSAEYIQWVNTICSSSVKIKTLSELRQGDALIELLEELSGKTVKQLPPSSVGSISMLMLDNVVAVFKFLSMEGIDMDDDRFTIKDIFSGREDKIKLMLQTILNWSIQLNDQ